MESVALKIRRRSILTALGACLLVAGTTCWLEAWLVSALPAESGRAWVLLVLRCLLTSALIAGLHWGLGYACRALTLLDPVTAGVSGWVVCRSFHLVLCCLWPALAWPLTLWHESRSVSGFALDVLAYEFVGVSPLPGRDYALSRGLVALMIVLGGSIFGARKTRKCVS